MKNAFENQEVTVCALCKQATCWMGIFYCDNYKNAGLQKIKVKDLRKLQRKMYGNDAMEHEDWWYDQIYGDNYGISWLD